MRIVLFLTVAMLLLSCSRENPTKQPPANEGILPTVRTIEPGVRQVGVLLRIDAGDSDILLTESTLRPEFGNSTSGEFVWWTSDILEVVLEERASGKSEVLTTVRQQYKDCCFVRVLRATKDEIVLSQTGEKSDVEPDTKFFIDLRTRSVRRLEFRPFPIQKVQVQSGVPNFIAGDLKQFLVIRASTRPPFLELASGSEAATIISALDVERGSVGGEEIRKIGEKQPVIRFGPSNRFRLDPQSNGSIFETVDGRDQEFQLPQSTRNDFMTARPSAYANSLPPGPETIEETIGPSQLVGSRLWFGKTFYDGEGHSGVGGIGYFDTSTRHFTLMSVPEIKDFSVSALWIEDQIMWVGLDARGEGSDAAGGLLRIDLASMRTQRYALPAVISSIVRYEDRLYLATSDGVTILPSEGPPEQYFIDVSQNGSFQLSR